MQQYMGPLLIALALIFIVMAAALKAGVAAQHDKAPELKAAADFFEAGALPFALLGAAAAFQGQLSDSMRYILAGAALLFVILGGSLKAAVADGDDKKDLSAAAMFFESSSLPLAIVAAGAIMPSLNMQQNVTRYRW